LLDRGQLELISATYTPSIWVAFPGRDLQRSIIRNQSALADMGLNTARIFFCQESFFGQGVSQLMEWFDCAVVKDQYLDYLYGDLSQGPPVRLVGHMPVMIASNHLLNELSARVSPGNADLRVESATHLRHLRKAATENSGNVTWARHGTDGRIEWLWYHVGDGNHFSTLSAPNDWERFFRDDVWLRLNESLLRQFECEGYSLCRVGDLYNALSNTSSPTALPPLVEGSWNTARSEGVFTWMGQNKNSWENDAGILAYASRTRSRLVHCEKAIARIVGNGKADLERKLDAAWDAQLYAESSDPLGWMPTADEVAFGVRSCDEVWMSTAAIAQEADIVFSEFCGRNDITATTTAEPFVPYEIRGGEGAISTIQEAPDRQLVEALFVATSAICGIRFSYETSTLTYCPSGMETTPLSIDLSTLRPEVLSVPLANGLIQIGANMYLIKELSHVHVAARIVTGERFLDFTVGGSPIGKEYRWRFRIFCGELVRAVDLANRLNNV
jgi:hypothetical protein